MLDVSVEVRASPPSRNKAAPLKGRANLLSVSDLEKAGQGQIIVLMTWCCICFYPGTWSWHMRSFFLKSSQGILNIHSEQLLVSEPLRTDSTSYSTEPLVFWISRGLAQKGVYPLSSEQPPSLC